MTLTPEWLSNAIFYQIYPQSFYDSNGDGIGDIQGIIEKLDYINWLGCNAIWINPCFESPFNDAGYDISNYYKIAKRYGSNSDIKNLVEIANKKEIKVCLDLVPGHTSIECKWFNESCSPESNKYSNRYIWTDSVWKKHPPEMQFINGYSKKDGRYLANYFWSQPGLNYGFANPDSKMEWQLGTDHPDVQCLHDGIMNIMKFWLDTGIAGFRVDMAFSLVKNDPDWKYTSKFWQKTRKMIDSEYPEAVLIAEWSDPISAVNAGFHGDFMLGFHNNVDYQSLFRMEDKRRITEEKSGESFFEKEGKGSIETFTTSFLKHYESVKDRGFVCLPSGNHDVTRISLGRTASEIEMIFAFLLTMPTIPFIYYGDEIGMEYQSLTSKEGGYGRTGSRTPMQWDNTPNAGFANCNPEALYLPISDNFSSINIESQKNNSQSLLSKVRKLISLRQQNPSLGTSGKFEIVFGEKEKYPFIYRRKDSENDFLVVINPSDKNCKTSLKDKFTRDYTRIMGSEYIKFKNQDDKLCIHTPMQSYGLYSLHQ